MSAQPTHWIAAHGLVAVFVGRLTPLLRSFVSIPAWDSVPQL
jgi:membrane protein DedA with SNARE-associated domain